jgi:hypothetical protein
MKVKRKVKEKGEAWVKSGTENWILGFTLSLSLSP